MLTATKAKRTTTKLVTDNNRELVVVCCLDKRRGIVLAVLGDGTGDCWAEELHADHVRGLTPDDVYCDAAARTPGQMHDRRRRPTRTLNNSPAWKHHRHPRKNTMLVLSRKHGERIIIGDGEIIVTVVEIQGGKVRLGITAPKDMPIHREEVHEAIKEKAAKAA
jgi:carbon storage regulator